MRKGEKGSLVVYANTISFGLRPIYAPRLGAFAALARAGADQFALELGKPA